MRKLGLTALALASGLALTGCGPESTETTQETASASPSASASPTKTSASPKPSKTATATPSPKATEAPAPAVPADDGMTTTVAEFLNSGGVCNSDFFPAGPPTQTALTEIQAHCAAQVPATGGYTGYVEPGFEHQVGTECFDPALGRCKSSGEIQSEWLEQNAPPVPPAPPEGQGFGCFKDENGNDYCVDPGPPIP